MIVYDLLSNGQSGPKLAAHNANIKFYWLNESKMSRKPVIIIKNLFYDSPARHLVSALNSYQFILQFALLLKLVKVYVSRRDLFEVLLKIMLKIVF